MDKFDQLTSYTQKLLEGYENRSDDNMSETSQATAGQSNIAIQDMFGNNEVETKNPNPVRGKKYLIFTIFMVIVLSFMVVRNDSTSVL